MRRNTNSYGRAYASGAVRKPNGASKNIGGSPRTAGAHNTNAFHRDDTTAQNAVNAQSAQRNTAVGGAQSVGTAQRSSGKTQNARAASTQSYATGAQQTDQLDNLVNTASKHLNTTPEELKTAAQSGNIQKLLSSLSQSQAAQLERILSDEDAAKKLLSTPQAQALLRGMKRNE